MDNRVRKITRRIYLSSNGADRFPFGLDRSDNVIFDFITPIVCRNNQQIFMSLESFSVPNLAYNFPENARFLNTNRGVIVLKAGYYSSIQQVLTTIEIEQNLGGAGGFKLQYDAITNKIKIDNLQSSVLVIEPSSAYYQLGFNQFESLTIPPNGKAESPRQIDLSSGRAINFSITNFDFNAIDSFGISTQTSSILASIPLAVGFGQIQTYSDYDVAETMTLANTKNISELDIRLLNLDNTAFDIGGTQWSAVILVTIAG